MKIRTGIAGLLACMLLSGSIFAQQGAMKTPQERAERQIMWMQKNLGLSEEQNKKVHELVLRHAKEAEQVRGEVRGKEKNMDRREIQTRFRQEMAAILTPEQMKKLDEHVADMKAKARDRRNANMQGDN